jgi:segregation and condensation protein B
MTKKTKKSKMPVETTVELPSVSETLEVASIAGDSQDISEVISPAELSADGLTELVAGTAEQIETENAQAAVEVIAESSDDTVPTALITDRSEIKRALEALIFASPKAISLRRIKGIMTSNNFDVSLTDEILEEIETEFANRGFQLKKVASSYQFRTNPSQSDILEKLLEDRPVRLSASALEVLAIVAYKQPVTRAEVDAVRGIDSSHLTRGLMEKNLIRSEGHAETPGRPLLFGTTPYFLEIFGLNSLDDLPSAEEFEKELSVPGDIEREDAASVMLGDNAELFANGIFHDRPSGLPANPERGDFDQVSEESISNPDFGVEERALSEA